MVIDITTHFLDEAGIIVDEQGLIVTQATLCGLPVEAIILNNRPPTCHECHDTHAREGWLFPLPAVVTAVIGV